MTIQERSVGSVVVLDLSGRLVLGDGEALLKDTVAGLLKQGRRQVLLNMSDVSYVDSSGIGVLVGSSLNAKGTGGAVKLLNPSKRVHDALSLARLLPMLEVCSSEADALHSFDAR